MKPFLNNNSMKNVSPFSLHCYGQAGKAVLSMAHECYSLTIRTLTDANHTCFRLTSQCIFIYFSATRYDRRYYVIILLNVTLNTISVGKTVQRKPRRSCSARTICCTRRNPFNRTNGKFPLVYTDYWFAIISVCLGCVTPVVV